MRYDEFKQLIQDELLKHPAGLTWVELRNTLDLPYDRPCHTWINQMEQEIGLVRVRGEKRAYIWKITSKSENGK
jgi:hypothetical protein